MGIAIVCSPSCDVKNFEINLTFLMKLFFYMIQKSRQKVLSWKQKELLRWNKMHFSSILRDFQLPNILLLLPIINEVCELVWIFILYRLSRKYNKNNVGLYRDHGLAVFKNMNDPQAEKIKKCFQNIIRKNNLNIIVKWNSKIVDYLAVKLNLSDGSHKPFHKPNS